MEKIASRILIGSLILLVGVMVGAFLIIGMLKLALYLIIMFLINFIFDMIIKREDEFRMRLALGLNPETNHFRNLELLKFILVWVIYVLILTTLLPGLRTGINIIDFLWDTLTLCLHIFSSTVYTKNGQVRVLYARHSEEQKFIFPPGYFLSPAIWFRFRVSSPMILSFSRGRISILPVEEEEPNENIFHFYQDERLVRLESQLKGSTALLYNMFFLNAKKIRFTEEWSMFRIGTSIFLALIVNIILYFTILNSYYSNTITLDFFKKRSFQKEEVIKKEVTKKDDKKSDQKEIRGIAVILRTYGDFFQDMKEEIVHPYRNVYPEYSDQQKKYIIGKYISATGKYKGESYEKLSANKKRKIIEYYISLFGEPILNNKESSSWTPNRPFIEDITWAELIKEDSFSVSVKFPKNADHANIVGNFVPEVLSDNYYPHVYVIGYKESQEFFYNFFRVEIRKLTLINGEVWTDLEMDMSKYVSIIKNPSLINDSCYRDIRIIRKKQFSNIEWLIFDAGWGKEAPFIVFVDDGQYVTSILDSKKFGMEISNILE